MKTNKTTALHIPATRRIIATAILLAASVAVALEAVGQVSQSPRISGPSSSGQPPRVGDGAWYSESRADWKVAQASGSQATPPRDLVGKVGELDEKVRQLEGDIAALQSPNRFVIIGLFSKDRIPEIQKLEPGTTAGLPTIHHNWKVCPEEPCGRAQGSNLAWVGRDTPPANWAWTHVSAKTFASPMEASQWLRNSYEGRFLAKYAAAILAVSVTDYGHRASPIITNPSIK